MDKNYITCLEKIIHLEECSMTQKETLKRLNYEISWLGESETYPEPIKQEVYMPEVRYYPEAPINGGGHTSYGMYAEGGMVGGAVLFGLIGFSGGIFGAIAGIVIGGIIGPILGIIFALISSWMEKSDIEATNNAINARNQRAYEEAQRQAQEIYEFQCAESEREYQEALEDYHTKLMNDRKRVENELYEKEILIKLCEDLKKKHEETLAVLNKFYDAAEIYETYRNIVAVCHICEYLKSGICTELTGKDGAFMIYKYEMYEKMKIDRLDNIISQLDQLHFDNQMLSNSLEKISDNVVDLCHVALEVKQLTAEANKNQIEAKYRNEQLMNNLGNQLSSYAVQINHQNAILAYNQECTANELQQLKWLEYFKMVS